MDTIEIQHIDIQSRQRQDMGDVAPLMESIKELGLIQPIVIEMVSAVVGNSVGSFPRLVAGRRRMYALMQLGHTHVFHGSSCDPTKPGFVFYHEQTELKRQLVEFEEDVRRKNRTWQEEVIGIDRIHKIKWAMSGEADAEWGQKQTGELLGLGAAKVSYTLRLANEILKDREGAIAKAESYTDAIKILLERDEAILVAEQNRRRALFRAQEPAENNTAGLPLFTEQPSAEPTIIQLSNMVFHGDFKTIAETDLPADFVSCALALEAPRTPEAQITFWGQLLRLLKNDSYIIADSYPVGVGWNTARCIVYWNILGLETDERVPFTNNVKQFYVFAKGHPKPFNPSNSSVFSANRDGRWPPASFIEFLLRPISQIGSTILMPCGGPCEAVARIGRYPISFESDEARYVEERESLRKYYESSLTKVEFR